MKSNKIVKFLVIVGLAGVLGGVIFGFLLAFLVLALVYAYEVVPIFAMIVSLFYIWSIYKQTRQKRWFVVLRRFIEIFLISTFLTAWFAIEDGLINFNNFDWTIIYICIGLVATVFTIYLIIAEYFPKSWINIEIEHILRGMQLHGLISEFEKQKKKK